MKNKYTRTAIKYYLLLLGIIIGFILMIIVGSTILNELIESSQRSRIITVVIIILYAFFAIFKIVRFAKTKEFCEWQECSRKTISEKRERIFAIWKRVLIVWGIVDIVKIIYVIILVNNKHVLGQKMNLTWYENIIYFSSFSIVIFVVALYLYFFLKKQGDGLR